MKKLYILFITLCTLYTPHSTHSQWIQQSLPVSGLVNDICFINANTGFVSMDTPALLKTTNGGTNWTIIKTTLIYHIQFLDNLTGYAHGYVPSSHRLYKTTNAGNTWDSMFIGQGAYGDISFVNKDTGWIGGWDQSGHTIVWNTTNGGQTIQLQFTTPGPFINNIFFIKESYNGSYYGWYTGSGGLCRTTNSGVNWNLYTNMPNQNAGSIFFLNKDTGWVTNYGTTGMYLAHTTNNGNDWIVQDLPNDYGSGDIYFVTHQKGWVGAGFGKIYATTNAGNNWGTQNITFSGNSLFFINSLLGWCGRNGLYKTTNGGGILMPYSNWVMRHQQTSNCIKTTLTHLIQSQISNSKFQNHLM